MPDASESRPQKQRRITRACDYCHQRSIRCSLRPPADGQGAPSCTNCLEFAQPCTFDRVPKKRGAPPRAKKAAAAAASATASDGSPSAAQSSPAVPGAPQFLKTGHDTNAGLPQLAPQAVVVDLVDLYFELVYPIFPFFHRPSFRRRISRAEYTTDSSLFSVTMAICALVSGRVRDGAVSNPRWTAFTVQTPPSHFYHSAWSQLRQNSMRSDLDTLRAHALLAITAVQEGATREMHHHIGQYHTLVTMDRLHDESEWPPHIDIVEREERRRLFWSIYTLDIYVSLVWGGVVHSREQQFRVSYPMELDDEDIPFLADRLPRTKVDQSGANVTQEHRDNVVQPQPPGPCWLYGWNFTTDLYRILEHAMTRFREPRANDSLTTSIMPEIFSHGSTDSKVTMQLIRDRVLHLFRKLPPCFQQTPPEMTYDMRKDLYAFQAANIIATVQLLRMVLFSVDDNSESSLNDRCQVATQVIEAFMSIPEAYQRAISAPLLHHLGGIGYILGGSASKPGLGTCTNPEDAERLYKHLRTVMLAMARLLAKLEGLVTSAHVTERLGKQIARIDQGIAQLQRQKLQRQQQESQRHKSFAGSNAMSESRAGIPCSTFQPPNILNEDTDTTQGRFPPDRSGQLSRYQDNLASQPSHFNSGVPAYNVNNMNYVPNVNGQGNSWNIDMSWVPVDVFADFTWALNPT